jgi:hypothetical protein
MRYLIGLIAIVLLFIVGSLLIGGNKKPTPTTPVMTLPDYASTDAKVSFNIGGAINGDDIHRAIRITVSRDQRLLETVQGYSGNVIDSHSQYNTQNAYSIFLKAINNSGFLVVRKGAKTNIDYTAICPLQRRYALTLEKGGKTLSQLWTSDCGSATGDFGGAFDTIIALFQNQITDYNTLTSQVVLNP